jgi:thiamine pyrophosphokinase
MNQAIVESSEGVTLVAGGPVTRRDFALALRRAPVLVAADGGADRAISAGLKPRAVIGDLDSLTQAARAALGPARLHRVAEQETTDFDKALRHIHAPFVLALGALGGRLDHELAVLNSLVRQTLPCVLIGAQDVVFAAPPRIRLHLKPGDRFSLFPMARVTGQSVGLRWPIDGLRFQPDGGIGTSNEVTERRVDLCLDGPGMLVILPRGRLDAVLQALVRTSDR